MLDAASNLAEGEALAGIADPEPKLRRNLEVLVEALNRDGRFGAEGRASAHQSLVRVTKDRLLTHTWFAEFPAIADERIESPVFLCGLPRSGTTYFQYLFDNDRRFRLVRTWDAIMPFPPPGHDPASEIGRASWRERVCT